MKRVPTIRLVSFVALTTVSITGCGLTKAQKDGIGVFGKATANLGTASKEQFVGGRERVIEMKRLQLAMEKKTLPARKPDGSAADRDFYAGVLDLDSGLDRQNIEQRVAAVELLIQYGNLLVAFSEETQEKELSAAADNFTSSIKKFPNNPLTTAEVDGLGQLVVVTGKMWVEHEKKEALKKIIPTVSPLIERVCTVLENDFDLKKRGVAAEIFNRQDRLANEAIDGLKREGGSLADRLLLIDGFALADRNKSDLEATSKKLLKTVAAMRDADKKLVSLINDDRISLESIKSFAADAKDLAKAVKPFIK